jgi:HK97 family phage major capsid protein
MAEVDITRNDVATLIQQAYADDFINHVTHTSAVLGAFPTKNLGTKTTNLPVLATKPHAAWVAESSTDPTGTKPTSKVTWANKTLVVEELAVIIPVHENVVDDATVDVIAEITKTGAESIAFALDAAVIFGIGKPLSWVSNDLHASAVADGNVFNVGATGTKDDLAGKFLQAAEHMAELYDPTTVLARKGVKYRLANLRATTGEPIFMGSMSDTPGVTGDSIYGMDTYFVTGTVDNGSGGDTMVWDPSVAEAMVVDRSRVIVGVRQDINVKFLDQAVVGGVSLAEKDMVALRFKARFAYCLGDNIAYGSTVTTNSPVSVIVPAGTGS